MALPSILLLLAFVGSVLVTVGLTLALGFGPDALDNNPQLQPATTADSIEELGR